MRNLLTTSVPNILPKRIPIDQRAPTRRIASNPYAYLIVATPNSSQITRIRAPHIDATSRKIAIPNAQNLVTHYEEDSAKNPSSVGDSNIRFDASTSLIICSANAFRKIVLTCNICSYQRQNSGSSVAKHFIRSFADCLEERNALFGRQIESPRRMRNVRRQTLFSA